VLTVVYIFESFSMIRSYSSWVNGARLYLSRTSYLSLNKLLFSIATSPGGGDEGLGPLVLPELFSGHPLQGRKAGWWCHRLGTLRPKRGDDRLKIAPKSATHLTHL